MAVFAVSHHMLETGIRGMLSPAFSLVLANGSRYLDHGAGASVAFDSVMVILFTSYLVVSRPERQADEAPLRT